MERIPISGRTASVRWDCGATNIACGTTWLTFREAGKGVLRFSGSNLRGFQSLLDAVLTEEETRTGMIEEARCRLHPGNDGLYLSCRRESYRLSRSAAEDLSLWLRFISSSRRYDDGDRPLKYRITSEGLGLWELRYAKPEIAVLEHDAGHRFVAALFSQASGRGSGAITFPCNSGSIEVSAMEGSYCSKIVFRLGGQFNGSVALTPAELAIYATDIDEALAGSR